MINSGKNPQGIVEMMVSNNPIMGTMLNMIKGSNKSPKDIFYEMAQKNGLDPDEIVSKLK